MLGILKKDIFVYKERSCSVFMFSLFCDAVANGLRERSRHESHHAPSAQSVINESTYQEKLIEFYLFF
jgi:hypothetical protein